MRTIATRKDRMRLAGSAAVLVLAISSACTADGAEGPVPEAVEVTGQQLVATPEEVEFTEIRDLFLDSRGHIYVLDNPVQLPVLSENGRLLRTVGRQGAGPGEFRGIMWAGVGRGDTLYVYDMELSRMTAFEPGTDRVASTVHLPEQYPLYPASVRRTPDGTLIAIYRRVYADDAGREEGKQAMDLVRLLGADGAVLRDSLLLLREQQLIEISEGSRGSIFWNPFGRRSILRVASDGRIVTVWTDSARFEVRSPEGRLLETIEARDPPAPRQVLAAESDSLVAEYSRDGRDAPGIRRALERLNHRTWPLVHDFVLDDRDRIWYATVPARGATHNTWIALDARGNAAERLALPVNATPHVIRGGRAYVSETDSLDVPRVVVYDLQAAPSRRSE